MSKIINEVFEDEVSYEDRSIENIWLKNDIYKDNSFNYEDIYRFIENTKQVLCMCLSEVPRTMLISINRLFERGVRVYIYTTNKDIQGLTSISGKALIRFTGETNLSSYLLRDPKEVDASVLMAGTINKTVSNWIALTDRNIINETYQYFCYHFWHMSDNELSANGRIVVAKDAPYDVFPLVMPVNFYAHTESNSNLYELIYNCCEKTEKFIIFSVGASIFREQLIDQIKKCAQNAKTIFIKLRIEDNSRQLIDEFKNIYNIKFFAEDEDSTNYVIFDTAKILILSDTPRQGTETYGAYFEGVDATKYIQQVYNKESAWTYAKQTTFRDIKSSEIVYIHNNERVMVQDQTSINLGNVTSETLATLKNHSYDTILREESLGNLVARKVKFSICLQPVYRDKNTKVSACYSIWENEIKKYMEYLNALENCLDEEIEEKSAGKDFIRFLLGRKSQFSKLKKEVIKLRESTNNIKSVIDLVSEFDNANSILDGINDMVNQTATAKEKDAQEKDWNKQRTDAQNKIKELQDKAEDLEKRYNEADGKLDASTRNQNIEKTEIDRRFVEDQNRYEKLIQENPDLIAFDEKINKVNEIILIAEKREKRIKEKNGKKKNSLASNALKELAASIDDLIGEKGFYSRMISERIKRSDSVSELILYLQNDFLKELQQILNLTMDDNISEAYRNLKTRLSEKEEQKQKTEKNHEVGQNIIRVEIAKFQKEMGQCEEELENAERQLDILGAEFRYNPELHLSNEDDSLKAVVGKKSNSNNSGTVRKNKVEKMLIARNVTDIPQVGMLYEVGSIRELAISDWVDYSLAVQEAEKFKAELVCEVN